ncbi:MAG TPA: hypothetical protein VNI35_01585, partial [Nitrospira sp.]|nr:hypothetical protein [Nitrospira sp.]
MRIDRRTLLRLTGVSLLAAAGKKVVSALGAVVESVPAVTPARARRWAMVIDLPKCLKDESCTKCITACHRLHNVPLIENSRHEVKWIWKASFENVFPSQENPYIAESLHGKQVPVFCN